MRNLSYENEFGVQFHFHAIHRYFNNNDFVLRLALKQRHKGTHKWLIGHVGFFQGVLTGKGTAPRGLSEESATIIPGT